MKTKNKISIFILIAIMLVLTFSFQVYGAEVELNGSNITVYKDYYKLNGVRTDYSGVLNITNSGTGKPHITIAEDDVSIKIQGNMGIVYVQKNCDIEIDAGYTIDVLRTLYPNRKTINFTGTETSGAKTIMVSNTDLTYSATIGNVFDITGVNLSLSSPSGEMQISDFSSRNSNIEIHNTDIRLPNFKYTDLTLKLYNTRVEDNLQNSYDVQVEQPSDWESENPEIEYVTETVYNTIQSVTLVDNSSVNIENDALEDVVVSENSSATIIGKNLSTVSATQNSTAILTITNTLNSLEIDEDSEVSVSGTEINQTIDQLNVAGEVTFRDSKYTFTRTEFADAIVSFLSSSTYNGYMTVASHERIDKLSTADIFHLRNNGRIKELSIVDDITVINKGTIDKITSRNAVLNLTHDSNSSYPEINIGTSSFNVTNNREEMTIENLKGLSSGGEVILTNGVIRILNDSSDDFFGSGGSNSGKFTLNNVRLIAPGISSLEINELNSYNSSVLLKDTKKRIFASDTGETHLIDVILNNIPGNYRGNNLYASIENNRNYFKAQQSDTGVVSIPVPGNTNQLYIKIDGVEYQINIQNRVINVDSSYAHASITKTIKTFFLVEPVISNISFTQPTRHEAGIVTITFDSSAYLPEDMKLYFVPNDNSEKIEATITNVSGLSYSATFQYPGNFKDVPKEYNFYLYHNGSYDPNKVLGTVIVPKYEVQDTKILDFIVPNATNVSISDSARRIQVYLGYNESTTITPTIILSPNCSITPPSGTPVDISSPVTYTVINTYDNSSSTYQVVLVQADTPLIREVTYTTNKLSVVGDYLPETINYKIYDSSDREVDSGSLRLNEDVRKHEGRYRLPANNTNHDIDYTVKFYVNGIEISNDGNKIITSRYARSNDTSIDSIDIPGSVDVSTLDSNTYLITMPYENNDSVFFADIVLSSSRATYSTNRLTLGNNLITVTAEDGTIKTYTIRVIKESTPIVSGLVYTNTMRSSGGSLSIQVTGQNVVTISDLVVKLTCGSEIIQKEYNGVDTKTFSIPRNNGSIPKTYQIKVYANGVEVSFPVNYTLTVERPYDSSTTISFYIPEQIGVADISGNEITIDVPFGTDVTNLTPNITIPTNATVYPPSGVSKDFSAPVVYTVTAEDGSTKTYTVTVEVADTPIVTNIQFDNPTSGEEEEIDFTVLGRYFTNASAAKIIAKSGDLILQETCTGTVNRLSCSIDFPKNTTRMEKVYSILVQVDGTVYDIGKTLRQPFALSGENYITSFTIPGQISSEILYNRINVVMPYRTDLSALRPYIAISDFATVNPTSNTVVDFTSQVPYKVTAENGSIKTYTVKVTTTEELYIEDLEVSQIAENKFKVKIIGDNLDFINNPKLKAKDDLGNDIDTFDFDSSNHTATITLPENTTNYDQFYNLFIYDGDYAINTPETRVKVSGVFSSENLITDFVVDNALRTIIDHDAGTIKVYVDESFNLQYVIPEITLSTGAIVSPVQGTRINITNPVLYTVTAEDTTTKEYIVSSVVEPDFKITDILYTPTLDNIGGNVEFTLLGSRLYTKNITLTVTCAECGAELTTGTFVDDKLTIHFPENDTYIDNVYNLTLKVDGEIHTVTNNKKVTVSRKLYSGNDITDFYFYGIKNININSNSIDIEVYNNIDITNIKPLIEISTNATIHPDNIERDFSTPVIYTVISENGIPKEYTVNVTKVTEEQPIPSITKINGLENISVLGETRTFIIEGENLDNALDIGLLFRNEEHGLEYKGIATKAGGVYTVALDFESNPRFEELEFTVEYLLNREYHLIPETLKQNSMSPTVIDDLAVNGLKNREINESNSTINIEVYTITDITDMVISYIVQPGLTVLENNIQMDYSTPQEITVQNLDGSTRKYTVNVIKIPEPENLELTFEKQFPYGGHIIARLTGDNIEGSRIVNLSYMKEGDYFASVVPFTKQEDGSYKTEFDLSYSINRTSNYEMRVILDTGIGVATVLTLEELTLIPTVHSISANRLGSAGGRLTITATGENLHVTDHSSMVVVSKRTGYTYSANEIIGSENEMVATFVLPGNTEYEPEEYELSFFINYQPVSGVEYPVIIVDAKLRTENEILSFDIPNNISTSIDGTNIDIVMPYYSDITYLAPIITISEGATVTPESSLAQDFTNPVEYGVVSEDGSVRIYTVTVSKQPKPHIGITNIVHDVPETYEETEVLFNVFGENLNLAQVKLVAYENDTNNEISAVVSLNNGAYLASMIFPENKTAVPKVYTVKSFIDEEETGVNVTVVMPGHLIDPLITNFTIPGQISSTINNELGSIKITVPYLMNVSNIVPTIDMHNILTISPEKTSSINLTSPVTYTVSNGQIDKTYTVYIERENTYEITDFDFKKPSSNNPGEIEIQIIGEDISEIVNLLTLKLHPEDERKKVIEGEIFTKNNKIYAKVKLPKNTSSENKEKYLITAYISNEKFDYTETISVPAKESSGSGGGGGGGGSSSSGGISGGSSNKDDYNPPVVSPPILINPKPEEPTIKINKNANYIKGYEDNTFKPNNSVTRAEVAVMLSRLITDFDNIKVYPNYFSDVQPGMWYTNAINFMKEKGIIKGDTAGTFRPTDTITRGEFAAILSRMLELPLENNISNITDINGTLFEKEIYSLIKKGIVSGYEDNTFKPNNSITRAEVVKMINFGIGIETRYNLTNIFYDLYPEHWAYNYILSVATR